MCEVNSISCWSLWAAAAAARGRLPSCRRSAGYCIAMHGWWWWPFSQGERKQSAIPPSRSSSLSSSMSTSLHYLTHSQQNLPKNRPSASKASKPKRPFDLERTSGCSLSSLNVHQSMDWVSSFSSSGRNERGDDEEPEKQQPAIWDMRFGE